MWKRKQELMTQTAPMSLTEQLREREAERKRKADAEKSDAGRRHRELLERAKTIEQYRELLSRQNTPAEGDADALDALLALLGITLDDLEQDIAAAAKMQRLRAGLKTDEEIAAGEAAKLQAQADYQRVIDEKRAAIAAAALSVPDGWLDSYMQKLDRSHGAECEAHLFGTFRSTRSGSYDWAARQAAASAAVNSAKMAHREATREIAKLEAAHPRVFGGPDSLEAKA